MKARVELLVAEAAACAGAQGGHARAAVGRARAARRRLSWAASSLLESDMDFWPTRRRRQGKFRDFLVNNPS